jgi:hypothetical protein
MSPAHPDAITDRASLGGGERRIVAWAAGSGGGDVASFAKIHAGVEPFSEVTGQDTTTESRVEEKGGPRKAPPALCLTGRVIIISAMRSRSAA